MSDTTTPGGKRTLVEEGTEFKGSMTSSCPIVVMGKIEGEVAGPSIHVTATGVVAGVVKVTDLRSDGELAGEVNADTVTLAGRVRDNTVIRARTLAVSLSRTDGKMEVVFGHCELSVGDEPNKQAAIAAALAPPAPAAAATATAPAPAASGEAAPADWDDKDKDKDKDDAAGKRTRDRNRTQPPPQA